MDHFEQRLEAVEGKAMIVCMSRKICVDLYKKIVELRQDWHGEEDEGGKIKSCHDRLRPPTRRTGNSTSAQKPAAKPSPTASATRTTRSR